jgi:uncharacterized protein (DUF1778 family)
MKKETAILIRASLDEKTFLKKAAHGTRGVSAFLLSSARKVWKYRRLIEQAEKLERQGIKTSAMEVRA